jgi:hypothetical protein
MKSNKRMKPWVGRIFELVKEEHRFWHDLERSDLSREEMAWMIQYYHTNLYRLPIAQVQVRIGVWTQTRGALRGGGLSSQRPSYAPSLPLVEAIGEGLPETTTSPKSLPMGDQRTRDRRARRNAAYRRR